MEKISDGNVVEMDYTLTNSQGNVLDSSQGKTPLAYIHGQGNIIPGLEKQLSGKKVGDKFKATINPEDAYGVRDEAMMQTVPKEQFGEHAAEIQVGVNFRVEDPQGQEHIVTVIKVSENEVVLDGNHPLAGETLHFDIEVVSLRNATEEELSSGQVAKTGESCQGSGCC